MYLRPQVKRALLLMGLWFGLPLAYGSGCCSSGCSTCRAYFEVGLGAYRLDAPDYSFGELLNIAGTLGIADIPEFAEHERVDGFFPRLAFGIEFPQEYTPCWLGNNLRFELSGFYFERDFDNDSNSFALDNFAFPLLDGSGDFIAVTSGLTSTFSGVDFDQKYRYSGVAAKLASDFCNPFFSNFTFTPFVEIVFDVLHQGYIIDITSITGGIAVTDYLLDQSLDTNYFDFGLGINIKYAFSTYFPAITVFGEAAIFGSYAHTVFNGIESATSIVTSSFLDFKHDSFDSKFRGQVGFGYELSNNFALAIVTQVEHWGYIPQLVNPHRIAAGSYDGPVRIESENATNYAALLKLIFKINN